MMVRAGTMNRPAAAGSPQRTATRRTSPFSLGHQTNAAAASSTERKRLAGQQQYGMEKSLVGRQHQRPRALPETADTASVKGSGPPEQSHSGGPDTEESHTGGPAPDDDDGSKGGWKGYAELVAVSMLWGTYNPTLKLIYAEDRPLDASTLTAVRTVVSAVTLLLAVAWQRGASRGADGGSAAAQGQSPVFVDGEAIMRSPERRGLLAYSFAGVLPAGIELGLYNFAGTATQALGLQLTSATRASFLVQLTAILVPVISYLGGDKIPPQSWVAVGLGLLGSLLVAFDGISGSTAGSGSGADEIQGMAFIVASCVCYSLATIRLGVYAPRFDSVDLTAIKKLTLSTASLIWFFGGVHASEPQSMESSVSWADQLTSLGLTGRPMGSYALILCSALGPGAGATFLQTLGQASVPPTAAQVIYSLTPLWGAIAAQILLGSEGTGPLSWAGGATVLAASLLAAAAQAKDKQKER